MKSRFPPSGAQVIYERNVFFFVRADEHTLSYVKV